MTLNDTVNAIWLVVDLGWIALGVSALISHTPISVAGVLLYAVGNLMGRTWKS